MRFILLPISVLVFFQLLSFEAHSTVVPPHRLKAMHFSEARGLINEAQFNHIVDSITIMWAPIARLHGAELVVRRVWADDDVGATAHRHMNQWFLDFKGGLARRPEMTPDAFALVVCHELGHHFGGYYFSNAFDMELSAEGEADYFATHVCAPKVFGVTDFNSKFRSHAPPTVKQKCEAAWSDPGRQNVCFRIAAASLALGRFFARVETSVLGRHVPEPRFDTPDRRRVAQTNIGHPSSQCRLDTLFMGAVCTVPFDIRIIPGKNHPMGNNSRQAEELASRYSCTASRGFTLGIRPSCWFRSQISP